MPDVVVNLKPLIRFRELVSQDLRGAGRGPIRAAIRQWAARYRAFAQERFDRASKGGGEWERLSPATLAARRRKSGGKLRTKAGRRRRFRTGASSTLGNRPAILRDTGVLMAALAEHFTNKPGAIQDDIPFGVRVGYGGSEKHPSGGATIADIASFHQSGGGSLPKREIIVDPPQHVTDLMAGDMERALERAYR